MNDEPVLYAKNQQVRGSDPFKAETRTLGPDATCLGIRAEHLIRSYAASQT